MTEVGSDSGENPMTNGDTLSPGVFTPVRPDLAGRNKKPRKRELGGGLHNLCRGRN